MLLKGRRLSINYITKIKLFLNARVKMALTVTKYITDLKLFSESVFTEISLLLNVISLKGYKRPKPVITNKLDR
jgi:hypothetical protein